MKLQDYLGEERAVTAVPDPSPTEQYSSQVQGSERFSKAFDNFTRMTLHRAGVEYTRFDAVQEDPLAQAAPLTGVPGPDAPTERLPVLTPSLDDTHPTIPRISVPGAPPLDELSANGHRVVSPVDYMPTGRYGSIR